MRESLFVRLVGRSTLHRGGALLICSCLSLSSGCGEETLGQKVDRAVDDAEQAAKKAADEATKSTQKVIGEQTSRAEAWVAEARKKGDVSDEALAALKDAGEGASKLFAGSTEMAPAAIAIGSALYGAYDKDIDFDPIWQKVDTPEAQAELDESIKGMPRVETIEGVEVGFKDLNSKTTDEAVSESAYLVLWRQEDRVMGFVYRSRSRIDIEALIAQAPKLIELVRGADQGGAEDGAKAKEDAAK